MVSTSKINKGSIYLEYFSHPDSLWSQAIYELLLLSSNTLAREGWRIFHDATANDSRRWYLILHVIDIFIPNPL